MAISQNFPNTRPSLNLNFARSKKLDPRITFTRSSTATYVDEDGLIKSAATNTPRFDHDPTTGDCLGLLIEESRTNLTTYSEQFDNARWAVGNFTLSTNTSNTTAPDGTNTAEQILETTTNSNHSFYNFNAYAVSASTVYTASIFIKSINKQYVQLIFDDNATTNGGYVNFDLSSGTITASANYGTGASIAGTIATYPNSWYRISITSTAGTSATLARFSINGITSGSSGVFPGYVGNISNGYYIWGAQLETGAFPTSYIPTVASTVTRSADSASITGTNFSSWYNQSEGSIFVKGSVPYKENAAGGFVVLNDFTTNNRIDIRQYRFTPIVSSNGTSISWNVANPTIPTLTLNQSYRQAFAYSSNNHANSIENGFETSTTSIGSIPATRLAFGMRDALTSPGPNTGCTISQLLYYPVRLSNSQLQNLTK